MTRKKSIGYIRISSLSQQKGYSLEKQKTNICNFCKAYDIELISIYQDKKSGRNKNDGLQKLLKKLLMTIKTLNLQQFIWTQKE